MVSKLQMFLIYSFWYVLLDPHINFHVEKLTIFFKNIWMWDNVLYVNHVFLTLVGSKANSSSDNPWEQWMVFGVASWIGNWILVMINN